jgi:sulfur-carrier protein
MQIQVRYFAAVREALGEAEQIEVPAETTVALLRQALCARSARHAAVLGAGRAVRCAVNQRMVAESAAVPPGAEVAFFPPVTGG